MKTTGNFHKKIMKKLKNAANFFSILKIEYINYNNYRIRTKIKLTPIEKRCQYIA